MICDCTKLCASYVGECIIKFEETEKYFSDIKAITLSILNSFKLFQNQTAETIVEYVGFYASSPETTLHINHENHR
jgi:competence transcription factor ComK